MWLRTSESEGTPFSPPPPPRLPEEQEEVYKRRLEEELVKLRQMDERARMLLRGRQHIQERILTLRCPRCDQPYADFEGCCALTCETCHASFCAWCHWTPEVVPSTNSNEEASQAVHAHVAHCQDKPAEANGDPFFAPMDVVERHWRKKKRQLVLEELEKLEYGTSRAELLAWANTLLNNP